jgi:hypothetical protein
MSVKDPSSNSTSRHVASTRSARLEINLQGTRAYRGQSRHPPTHHTFIGLSSNPYIRSPRPCSSGFFLSNRTTHAPRTWTIAGLPQCLSTHRLHANPSGTVRLATSSGTYICCVCLHLVCRLLRPDFCLNVPGAAIDNRHHALHSASPSCRRRHLSGHPDCSSQGLRCER